MKRRYIFKYFTLEICSTLHSPKKKKKKKKGFLVNIISLHFSLSNCIEHNSEARTQSSSFIFYEFKQITVIDL